VRIVPAAEQWDAEHAVTAIYNSQYCSLVRLATLLVGDVATAEDIVRDSFIAMHGAWHRLRDSDKAVPYLRQCVVSRSRSVLGRRREADRTAGDPAHREPGAGPGAFSELEHSALLSALRTLPCREREALVLRFYLDLPEEQIASVMGVRRAAVKSHLLRATAAVQDVLAPGA
jgi:RNA polymerase sigma-70 factor (sigma-E family)